jgi:hypothetical protein
MSRKRPNPKKNKAARRRRPARTGLPRARFSFDDLTTLLSGAQPGGLPLVALAGLWLWNMSEDGHDAAHCIDGCLILQHALAEYGLESDVQATGVAIIHGEQRVLYDHARYHSDGAFDGHTILIVPEAGRFIDPTIQQFPEIPSSSRNPLPLMAQIPDGVRVGTDVFVISRADHTIAYPPVPEEERYAWRDPRVDAHDAEYRKAGAILAARAFDVMRHQALRRGLEQSPYPRLRLLLERLDGTTGVERADSVYCFRDEVTGVELLLSDVH